ncbi:MAG: phenylalanine--tRNA ligase subunit beta [Acidobacteriota bacterium]|jgi:phenylalanyl-tRNA synthetase beta chain|nr:phenylalanine--tRNA ligase subunit beta [Acidobacteriota bacterium]
MKISIEWLKEYVDLPESPERLKADLSMQGLLVESIDALGGDVVLDVEVTSNRPDCLSHVGMAREVAALYGRQLRKPPAKGDLKTGGERVPFAIEIADPELCPRYTGVVMDGVNVGPSPEWMRRRLEAAGMRPLNNVVDVTNYVLLETGHPLHAFDFDRLRGGKVVVRRATPGAAFQTLDGVERKLDGDMLMINDGEGAVAIAGVMGGLDSEIAPGTSRILIEAAYFQPASIRRTSRRLGLSTEAAYRFERGADWDCTVAAVARAAYLVEQLAGGRVAGGLKDVYPAPKAPVAIPLDRRRAASLLGVELSDDFVEATLGKLGFALEKRGEGAWDVLCPTFRADMELEADLVEELARFYGYDNIPATLPPAPTAGCHSPVYVLENAVREALCGYGHSEAVNLSFAAEADHLEFPPAATGAQAAAEGGGRVAVRNPLTEETKYMRTTLAAGLVRAARRNFNFSRRDVRLFEVGKTYFPGAGGVPSERNALGVLGTGGFYDANWASGEQAYTFYHMKGVVEALLQRLRVRDVSVEPLQGGVPWLDGADAACVKAGGEAVGVLGTLAPALREKFKLRQPVLLAEIDLERLAPKAFAPVVYAPLPKLPQAERDLSIVVGKELAFHEVRTGVEGLGIAELTGVRLIDVYEGEKIPEGKVSLTLRLTFLDRGKTLTIERIQEFMNAVTAFLTTKHGAGLR